MKKGNKESTWHYRITINKTIDERFKNLRTSEPDLSRRELKARKSNIARDVAHKFKEALENCKDLSKFIATFPTRLNIQTEEGRKVLDLYELYLKDPFDESRLAALEKAEDAWEITHEYQCYLGDPQQAKKLQSLDYCYQFDKEGTIKCFDICRARLAGGETCGCFMSAEVWNRPTSQYRFYCNLNWKQAENEDPWMYQQNAKIFNKDGRTGHSTWPTFGCGSRFQPWARGASKLVEIRNKVDGQSIFFLAERPPALIDDIIKSYQKTWIDSLGRLTPDEIRSRVPRVYPNPRWAPKSYPDIIGVGYFPVDEWEREGSPALDMAGWGVLFMCIATKNMENLGQIFLLGLDIHDKPKDYKDQAKTCPKTLNAFSKTPHPDDITRGMQILRLGTSSSSSSADANMSSMD